MSPINDKVVFNGHLRLCQACKTIFRAYEQGAIVVQMLHHGSLESMTQAVASGCYICAMVFADIERDRQTAALAPFPCRWETRCSIFENETEDPLRKLEVNHVTVFSNVRRKTVRHAPTKFRLLPCPGMSPYPSIFTLRLRERSRHKIRGTLSSTSGGRSLVTKPADVESQALAISDSVGDLSA